MIRSLLTALLATAAAPAQDEAASAPEGLRFEERDGAPALLWGEHVLMRNPALMRSGLPVDFDAARIRFEAAGDGYRVLPADPADADLHLVGTFALSFQPELIQLAAGSGEALQFVIGRVASESCDALVAPESGLALVAPGCMQLDFWLQGGPAELRIKLDEQPLLRLIDAPQRSEALLTKVRGQLRAALSDDKTPLPPEVEQMMFAPLPEPWQRVPLAAQATLDPARPLVVNLRVADTGRAPAFDLLLFHNPDDAPRQMTVDFVELGWEKPRRDRFAVLYPDGDCLGIVERTLTVDVPAGGWTIASLRYRMPRGVIASSDGPLAPLLLPWEWQQLVAAPTGVMEVETTWAAPARGDNAGWLVLSVADGRRAPLEVGTVLDEQDRELEFSQNGAWARVMRQASEAETRELTVRFQGREDGG